MSDFSTIVFADDFALLPEAVRRFSYQSKDLPDHETDTACIDGDIRSDGLFIRHDGLWNPCLNGWIRLGAQLGPHEFSLRFEAGRAVEVIEGRKLPAGAAMADDSPNQWCNPTE